ncbi:Uncharacterised protein [Mycobacteroides abscessus subsp. massiliense]|uniref:Uncharacterized protein n=1 Tax=Mycobacteroides abscessus TaxID=36809 RepID=A0A0U0ZMQ4_9MYCO|nr:hypothetical protein D2E33_08555 [Mycobacteroides abscessus]SHY46504.1 Uncharacterised protein [Mycobacteroides abscessus subsp. abscessus]SKG31408.1 Uncharacterised protein [Mycobacteroides abscessus subsp. massiliense]RIT66023.1 hypothetical protein D2E87_19165 [Mycobacteroides abscessus]CPT78582.1 Uncharacterised protein [Mycobacteroides abscessus]
MFFSGWAFHKEIVYQKRVVCTKQAGGWRMAITKSDLAKANSYAQTVLTAADFLLNESDEFPRD